MQEKARVVALDHDIVSVIPLDIEACIGCSNSECKTNGNVFMVVNTRNFDIRIGSEVRVAAPIKNQLLQAFYALGLPFLFGFGVWQMVPVLFPGAGEGAQVGGALLAFFTWTGFMFWHSRGQSRNMPEIIEVL